VAVHLAEVVRTLPRHAHSLSRRTVQDSQRWRLLEAMIEVTAKLGYADASVAAVIAAAGVSRKSFYAIFDDKDDCFLEAYDVVSDRLIEELVAIGAEHDDPDARLVAQVRGFLDRLSTNRAIARVFMVDVLGAGTRALRRRQNVNRRFAEALFGDLQIDPVRQLAMVGGVNQVVAGALLDSSAPALTELEGPLTAFVLASAGRNPPRRRTR
jgi:AcrR family transcriptional regulator